MVIGGEYYGRAIVYDARTGALVRELRLGHAVVSLALRDKGDVLACGDSGGRLWLHRYPGGEVLATLGGHADRVVPIAFGPGGHLAAPAAPRGEDQAVVVWNVPEVLRRMTLPPAQLAKEQERLTGLTVTGVNVAGPGRVTVTTPVSAASLSRTSAPG